MKSYRKYIIGIFILSSVFFSCAKIGSPSGGAKDTKAPVVKKSYPKSGTVNFSDKYFEIQFNEYVKLNNFQQNLMVSPPFSKPPKVKIKRKGIRVSFPETPKPNTTYSFTFLDAISDITESNAVQSLVYAFSTGSEIDSLRVSGRLEDAFTKEKLSGVLVGLYKTDNDSAFRLRQPDYLTKTNQNGDFSFFYLADGVYRIYALEDANYSYSFDQPNERIAFLDSLIIPAAKTTFDTIDSVFKTYYTPENLLLQMFQEENKRQYVLSSGREVSGCLSVVLAVPKDDDIKWLSPDFSADDVVLVKNETRDSLQFYLNSSTLSEKDSLQMWITYNSRIDSIGYETDTLYFPLLEKTSEVLGLTDNLSQNKLHYFQPLTVTADGLLSRIDTSQIYLCRQVNDSVESPIEFSVNRSLSKHKFTFEAKFKEGEKYRLVLNRGAVSDVLNRLNDSISKVFTYRERDSYSSLSLNVQSENLGFFCQLLKGDELVKQAYPDANGLVVFDFLEPNKYDVRLVFDKNKDKEWTSGNLEQKQQPEPVKYYPQKIELRANWKQEIDWILTQ